MKFSELKLRLKELGMVQTGTKSALEDRIKKGELSKKLKLQTPDGAPVHQLKFAKLKREGKVLRWPSCCLLRSSFFRFISR